MRKIHLRHEKVLPTGSMGLPEPWYTDAFNQGSQQSMGATQGRLILVIDDSPTVRKIVEISLRREGLEVVSYPDGIEALRAVTNRHDNRIPDLVVLDIELPRMSGYEIARYLRSKPQWSQTVIVILTRHDSIIDRLKARLAGTQAYLTKPFTTQMIVHVVTTCLGLPSASAREQQMSQLDEGPILPLNQESLRTIDGAIIGYLSILKKRHPMPSNSIQQFGSLRLKLAPLIRPGGFPEGATLFLLHHEFRLLEEAIRGFMRASDSSSRFQHNEMQRFESLTHCISTFSFILLRV